MKLDLGMTEENHGHFCRLHSMPTEIRTAILFNIGQCCCISLFFPTLLNQYTRK
jgi:hypothetical protein